MKIKPGDKFGMLTVIRPSEMYCTPTEGRYWECLCDCGKTKHISPRTLLRVRGKDKSCGCHLRDRGGLIKRHQRAVISWNGMRMRCLNPTNENYKDYGAKGITVCERWNHFENFLADMGMRPNGKTIDRIDNSKGYSPENCRWATPREQTFNRGRTHKLTINGELGSIADWARLMGIDATGIFHAAKKRGVHVTEETRARVLAWQAARETQEVGK